MQPAISFGARVRMYSESDVLLFLDKSERQNLGTGLPILGVQLYADENGDTFKMRSYGGTPEETDYSQWKSLDVIAAERGLETSGLVARTEEWVRSATSFTDREQFLDRIQLWKEKKGLNKSKFALKLEALMVWFRKKL